MINNKKLHNAKSKKDDEFYTKLETIKYELDFQDYQDAFKDKIIYCNCDGESSKFVEYFTDLKAKGIIKELIYTSNDYKSPENIENLKRADIIATNPPWSKFREYIDYLFQYDKEFVVLGNISAITYKEIFERIYDRKLWTGINFNYHGKYDRPDGTEKEIASGWYTNIPLPNKRVPILKLSSTYNSSDYPKYDNYDAIESKTKKIPIDYDGCIGVPITAMKYFKDGYLEFEIDDED